MKSINSVLEYENSHSSCLFSNIVRALPRRYIENEKTQYLASLPKQHIENEKTQCLISLPKKHIEHEKPHSSAFVPGLSGRNEETAHSSAFVPSLSGKNEETDLVVSGVFPSETAIFNSEKDNVSLISDFFYIEVIVLFSSLYGYC